MCRERAQGRVVVGRVLLHGNGRERVCVCERAREMGDTYRDGLNLNLSPAHGWLESRNAVARREEECTEKKDEGVSDVCALGLVQSETI